MIWQEKVQTIAMVTNLSEGRQKMCEQYWPTTGSAEYGPFMITLVETQVFADYTIRSFQLVVSTSSSCLHSLQEAIRHNKHNDTLSHHACTSPIVTSLLITSAHEVLSSNTSNISIVALCAKHYKLFMMQWIASCWSSEHNT